MFGAIAKTYYAKLLNVDPSKIFCVSIMPCTAKKHESDLPNINAVENGKENFFQGNVWRVCGVVHAVRR